MARYQKTMYIAAPLAETFAYVSNFQHATWDPRVSSAKRTDGGGPIGVGSTFVLCSPMPIGSIDFHYRITEYDPPRRVTLAGKTWFARYQDVLTCAAEGAGTSLHYDARFSLRGLLWLGSPLMSILFQRIGNDATAGIPTSVTGAGK